MRALSLLLPAFLSLALPALADDPVDLALPMVGSGGNGHTYPGATVPFGMVQLSPDTKLQGWEACSGYVYKEKKILGFSHTHLSGTGCADLGDIALMPTVGENALDPLGNGQGVASRFSHDKETAKPGYYHVFLDDPKVDAELTATERVGVHRYTFPASDHANVVIDLIHGLGNTPKGGEVSFDDEATVSGQRKTQGWAADRDVYFVARFSKPFASHAIEADGKLLPGAPASARGKIRAVATFETKAGEAITVKVGISGTSVEAARRNLEAEAATADFDAVHAAATKKWSDALSTIAVETPDPALARTFYSNLYLSFLAPTLFCDADGGYRGMDHKNHPNPGFETYTTFSLWDVYRAEAPLLEWIAPEREKGFVGSLLAGHKEMNQHALPVWPLWGNETWCMIGNHAIPWIAMAWRDGFRDFDSRAALAAIEDAATAERNFQPEFNHLGYVPSPLNPPEANDGQPQSVSRTIEYSYDAWCLGHFAKELGQDGVASQWLRRAGNYRNVYDPVSGFMRGRSKEGAWRTPFLPNTFYRDDYTEADAWQYTFGVQHDVSGLVTLMGGDDAFVAKLDALFSADSKILSGVPDITGLVGQYSHGNEPCHHVAYLYDYAGAPWKTQEKVRQIAAEFYSDKIDGQCGNVDCGQMAAWYVFTALGFYPVNPAGGVYAIGSPIIAKATVRLHSGKSFTVVAENSSAQNIYVQSAALNDKPLNRCWIGQNEIAAGGTLRLVMGPKPNPLWAAPPDQRPPEALEE